MTLRPVAEHGDAAPIPVRAMHTPNCRDPRTTLFVLALVAASPLGTRPSAAAFARRLQARRGGRI